VSFDYVDAEANEDYVVADEGSGAYPLSSPHTWTSGGLLFHAYAVPRHCRASTAPDRASYRYDVDPGGVMGWVWVGSADPCNGPTPSE
jgi:hypothetical protein